MYNYPVSISSIFLPERQKLNVSEFRSFSLEQDLRVVSEFQRV